MFRQVNARVAELKVGKQTNRPIRCSVAHHLGVTGEDGRASGFTFVK